MTSVSASEGSLQHQLQSRDDEIHLLREELDSLRTELQQALNQSQPGEDDNARLRTEVTSLKQLVESKDEAITCLQAQLEQAVNQLSAMSAEGSTRTPPPPPLGSAEGEDALQQPAVESSSSQPSASVKDLETYLAILRTEHENAIADLNQAREFVKSREAVETELERERSAHQTDREELDRAREERARALAERDAARNELTNQGRQADGPPISCGPGCVTF